MWSQRLKKSLESLGHQTAIYTSIPPEIDAGDVAIVNLGSPNLKAETLVPMLKAAGIRVIAHAGHKEKELRELGTALGCDRLASNSELTFKIESLLEGS